MRGWLAYNAASNYVSYDAETDTFALSDVQAGLLADPDNPLYMAEAYNAAAAYLDNQEKVEAAFRNGCGVGWGDQSGCLFCAVARFFRPGYSANIVDNWLPALDGVVEKLERGARVVDVGCGQGYSTLMMAEAFPNSKFIGIDFHADSIDHARRHAVDHSAPDNVSFITASAQEFAGEGYDLATCFDCLHDMGDPEGAARHIRQSLANDGTWMIVEPFAHDTLEENINPVSRLYYAASTMVCVPASLDQDIGTALGAQAGERRLSEIIVDGGFRQVRRVAETPFNMILEAGP